MSEANKRPIILDASVLINFVHIKRIDLISGCWAEVRVIEQVEQELEYADHQTSFGQALQKGELQQCALEDPAALDEALYINQVERRGKGESYSFVYAKQNNFVLALDDKKARSLFANKHSALVTVTSKDLIVRALKMSLIDLSEADEIKEIWAKECRYRLKITSFSEIFPAG